MTRAPKTICRQFVVAILETVTSTGQLEEAGNHIGELPFATHAATEAGIGQFTLSHCPKSTYDFASPIRHVAL
jgi:hypothetical protein